MKHGFASSMALATLSIGALISANASAITAFHQEAPAQAPEGQDITDRLHVVGVITGGHFGHGIHAVAVIADQSKSYTLTVGASLPGAPDWHVKSIKAKDVLIANGLNVAKLDWQKGFVNSANAYGASGQGSSEWAGANAEPPPPENNNEENNNEENHAENGDSRPSQPSYWGPPPGYQAPPPPFPPPQAPSYDGGDAP